MRYITLISLGTLLLGDSLPILAIANPPRRIDDNNFASVDELFEINQHIGGTSLRGTASSRQNTLIDWLDGQLQQIPNLELSYNSFNLTRWEPQYDNLHKSASLKIHIPRACSNALNVAGAIPYTRLTNGNSVKAELIYVPQETKIPSVNLTNKIVIRDVTSQSIPYAFFSAASDFQTADLGSLVNETYSRYVMYEVLVSVF